MPIDLARAKEYFRKEVARADVAEKLLAKYEAARIIERATSDEAQALWISRMADPLVQKLRIVELGKYTDADLKKAMRDYGKGNYMTVTKTKADKWAEKFSKFAKEIDAVVPTLAAKTDDVDANIDNRVKPIARALRAKKFEEVR